jgi:hypothetical protein
VLERSARVDPGQHKIKMVIVIVLKNYSGVNQGQNPGHEPGGSTKVDPGNLRIKVVIFIISNLT